MEWTSLERPSLEWSKLERPFDQLERQMGLVEREQMVFPPE